MNQARASAPIALFDLGDDLAARADRQAPGPAVLPVLQPAPLAEAAGSPPAAGARDAAVAALVIRQMGRLGYDGWLLGERDLGPGLDQVAAAAAAAKVTLLSANLTPVEGANPFRGSKVVQAGDLRVCAVAVHGQANYPPALQRGDPVVAARVELGALSDAGCDVKLLLAHMDRQELEGLLGAVPGFDVAVGGHQGVEQAPQLIHGALVLGAGARGRQVGRLRLGVAAAAGHASGEPFVDQGAGTRIREELGRLATQEADLQKRIAALPDPARTQAQAGAQVLRQRIAEQTAKLRAAEAPTAPRVYQFDWVNLGTEVADAKEVEAEVGRLDQAFPAPAATSAHAPRARPPGPLPFGPPAALASPPLGPPAPAAAPAAVANPQ